MSLHHSAFQGGEDNSGLCRHDIFVGLGEISVSGCANDSLVAVGLGSCVAVSFYDRQRRLGGMAHVVLPEGAVQQRRPGNVADSAVLALMERMRRRGARPARCEVKIAGGAAMFSGWKSVDYWSIGARNVETVKRALGRHGLRVRAEDTGGTASRVIELNIETGTVLVRRMGEGEREL